MSATTKANMEAEEFVLENELPRATPTIQKAVADIMDAGWHPAITNICGSHAGFKVIEHEACAAIDVVKRNLPDPVYTKQYLESLDLVCESHWNYSGDLAPDEEPDSHFHCVDKYFLEQHRRSVKKEGAADHVNEVLSYAYELSNDEKFIKLLVAENGRVEIDTVSRTGDIGFCQVAPQFHPDITNDSRFLTDWKWQIEQCYKLYQDGTRFYGADHLYRADGILTFL